MQTRTDTTCTRTCDAEGCAESLTLVDGQGVDMRLAIEMCSWFLLSSEVVTCDGLKIDHKTFCSSDCLKKYVDKGNVDLHEAEDRVLAQMKDGRVSKPSGLVAPDGKPIGEE